MTPGEMSGQLSVIFAFSVQLSPFACAQGMAFSFYLETW